MGKGIILDVPKMPRAAGLRNDAKGRGLEGTDEGLELCLSTAAEVSTLLEFGSNNLLECFCVFGKADGVLVWRCLGVGDAGDV